MACIRNSRILQPILFLFAVCMVSLPAQAAVAVRTYVCVSDQSTVVQTGGIAGVHRTYVIEGQFQLSVDPNAGIATFVQVDANATDDSPYRRTLDPNEVFNMTELAGTILEDGSIRFEGMADDGSDVLISLTFKDDSVHLIGETIPPAGSADFFIFSLDAVAQRKYGGGTGEPNDPYLIYTAEQMNTIGAEPNDWDKHFKLMADIDLSSYTGTDFNIIGYWRSRSDNKPFTGLFDGNSKKISNFTYTSIDASKVGLFGYVDGENARIKDLGLHDPNVDAGTGRYVGALVSDTNGYITGCYVEGGSVSGNHIVGGLTGYNRGTLSNCTSLCTVLGIGWVVGGLAGGNSGIITDCCSTSDVSAEGYVGGLVGSSNGAITNCYSVGSVSSHTTGGGLLGFNYGTVTASFWDIETSGQTSSAGGIGKTTVEMQTAGTFLEAGWDFVGETANGTEDIWWILEGQDYPRLTWELLTNNLSQE